MPSSVHESILPVGDGIITSINHEALPEPVVRISNDLVAKEQAVRPDPIFESDEAVIPRTQMSIDESQLAKPRSKLRILAVMTALFVSGNLVFLYNRIPCCGRFFFIETPGSSLDEIVPLQI